MGTKGWHHTPESKARLSAALKGRSVSISTRKKLSALTTKQMQSPEARAKISAIMRGNANGSKGWRYRNSNGYILVCSPNHPFCNLQGYCLEHRLVMERHLGRPLLPSEVVHHINAIRDDNRIENLMKFDSNGEHSKWHRENKKHERRA